LGGTDEIWELLDVAFRGLEVRRQWDVCKGSKDALRRRRPRLYYCPKPDYAVGPFNTDGNRIDEVRREIDGTYARFETTIRRILSSDQWLNDFEPNDNPRCFLAIEVEDRNSTKHRMGSILNACALGKVGIVIGANESTYRSLMRIREYLRLVEEFGKARLSPKNVAILTCERFRSALSPARPAGF